MTKVDETRSGRGASERASSADERENRGDDGNFDDVLDRKRRRREDRTTEKRRKRSARNERRDKRNTSARQRRDRAESAESERRRSSEQTRDERKYRDRRERSRDDRQRNDRYTRDERRGDRRSDRRYRETTRTDKGDDCRAPPGPSDRATDREVGARPIGDRSVDRPFESGENEDTTESATDNDIAAGPSGSGATEETNEPMIDTETGTRPAGSEELTQSAAADRADEVDRIRELARRIVDAVRVGIDPSNRQVVMVDAEVPGRGEVRIRLRRDGEGFEARLRADSEELARTIRRHEDELRESAREREVTFSSIDVVT